MKAMVMAAGLGTRLRPLTDFLPKPMMPVANRPVLHHLLNLLRRARELGDRLVVGLSSDHFNALKNKSSTQSYTDRAAVLRAIRYVDEVFPEDTWEQKADDIVRIGADLLVMGSDWTGRFDALSRYCRVHYLPRTEHVSSSSLKAAIRRAARRSPCTSAITRSVPRTARSDASISSRSSTPSGSWPVGSRRSV